MNEYALAAAIYLAMGSVLLVFWAGIRAENPHVEMSLDFVLMFLLVFLWPMVMAVVIESLIKNKESNKQISDLPSVGEYYRQHDGQIVKVIGISKECKCLVVTAEVCNTKQTWSSSAELWKGSLNIDGNTVPRFERIG